MGPVIDDQCATTWNPLGPTTYINGESYQLDDEPNLYRGNGWKSPFPSIFNWLALGFQVTVTMKILLSNIKYILQMLDFRMFAGDSF